MKKYIFLKFIKLDKEHKSKDKTRHFVDGNYVNENISELRIMHFENSSGFYLLYYDNNGNELTDTYHDTVEDALKQAEFEFDVKPNEWNNLDPAKS
jgi:hypothetical protein